jgi:hypothetical protein
MLASNRRFRKELVMLKLAKERKDAMKTSTIVIIAVLAILLIAGIGLSLRAIIYTEGHSSNLCEIGYHSDASGKCVQNQ